MILVALFNRKPFTAMLNRHTKKLFVGLSALIALPIIFIYIAILCSRTEFNHDEFSFKSATNNSSHYVIEPVSIVNVANGNILTKRQLVIANGTIVGINANGHEASVEAITIDGKNRYVVPGLIDMHTHIYDRKDLVSSLAYGVTSVRNMRGMPMHLQFKSELQSNLWLGASLYTSSPILDNSKAGLFQHALHSPEQAIAAVNTYKEAGYDLLKVYNDLPESILEAIIGEAEKLSMPIAKHGPYGAISDGKPDMTVLSKLQSVEHVEEIYQTLFKFDLQDSQLDLHLNQIKDSGSFLTPTLATFDHLTELSIQKSKMIEKTDLDRISPFFRFLLTKLSVQRWLDASPRQVEWNIAEREALIKITKRADELGVPLLVGSDQGTMYLLAGQSTHKEMQLMQKAGVSPETILRSATLNAAKALKLNQHLGSVEVGKIADLLLLESNPLDDINHLAQPTVIIKQGQLIDGSGIQTLKDRGNKPSGWIIGFGYLADSILTRYTATQSK
jgi:imidazolonepropionase-like amidohydrolase